MILAHSSKVERNIKAQSYAAHISGVTLRSFKNAINASIFSTRDKDILKNIVRLAAEYHDLGKLDSENQKTLSDQLNSKKRLPIQHSDAGVAYLCKINIIAAALVYSHHIGLPNFSEEEFKKKGSEQFRNTNIYKYVDKSLTQLIKIHKENILNLPLIDNNNNNNNNKIKGNGSVFLRIALSCLVDGDHTDTAIHYGQYIQDKKINLKPSKRLINLDNYINSLSNTGERSQQRTKIYNICKNTTFEENISFCNSPVGTGKTTAIMAHLLTVAKEKNLRRIIIVIPFTNIITQSVKVYRKALVLKGEKPEEVIAELHHRAEFESLLSRHLTALWKAPIIVTTAVAFFETLSSNKPAVLRRLHNLPGSAIFIDESHAALPTNYLSLAWHWIKTYASEWGCYWILTSGSFNKFWEISEFDENPPKVPEVIPSEISKQLISYEQSRVNFKYNNKAFDLLSFIDFINKLPGPCLVIVNTVKSAATIAKNYCKKFGRKAVEHISTALIPNDRKLVLERIKKRLNDENDINWVLIATCCVEAGVDFSFRSGVRELSSLTSLLQTAGRVNRNGEYNNSDIWSVSFNDIQLNKHPGFYGSSQILKDIFKQKKVINSELCTYALQREIREYGTLSNELLKSEEVADFPNVNKKFKIIDSDTRNVIIDKELIKRLEQHEVVYWGEIQNKSVQIWIKILESFNIPKINEKDSIYKWILQYDNFLGYMKGILK